jgi:predicted DsbA family dithiol-disulfide isomerase
MHIDIYSDLICPWCFIGKRRFDAVLASPVGEGVWVRWRPFQLYPRMPVKASIARLQRARFGRKCRETGYRRASRRRPRPLA